MNTLFEIEYARWVLLGLFVLTIVIVFARSQASQRKVGDQVEALLKTPYSLIRCPRCAGTGTSYWTDDSCLKCAGKGVLQIADSADGGSQKPKADPDMDGLGSLVALWGEVARIDQEISRAEMRRMVKVLQRDLRKIGNYVQAPEDIEDVHELVERYIDREDLVPGFIEWTKTALGTEVPKDIMRTCWSVVVADFDTVDSEMDYVTSIGRRMGLSEKDIATTAQPFVRSEQEPEVDDDAQKAFEKLGLKADATWENTKKTYRELSLKYHPDRHHAADDVLKDLASRKFQEFKEAYDFVREEVFGDPKLYGFVNGELFLGHPKAVTNCFFCLSHKLRLPEEIKDLSSARCPQCARLLLFPQLLAKSYSGVVAEAERHA